MLVTNCFTLEFNESNALLTLFKLESSLEKERLFIEERVELKSEAEETVGDTRLESC
jgi:hypothetical protein